MRYFRIFPAIFIALLFVLPNAAQTKRSKKHRLPRVGTIRDYPATGLTAGCGNSYYYFERRARGEGENYVFIASADARNVWMNLDGRDVSLAPVRIPRSVSIPFRASYRWRNVSIAVAVEDFKPPDAPYEEGDSMFRMKITLRRGRAVKTIRAVGSADC